MTHGEVDTKCATVPVGKDARLSLNVVLLVFLLIRLSTHLANSKWLFGWRVHTTHETGTWATIILNYTYYYNRLFHSLSVSHLQHNSYFTPGFVYILRVILFAHVWTAPRSLLHTAEFFFLRGVCIYVYVWHYNWPHKIWVMFPNKLN